MSFYVVLLLLFVAYPKNRFFEEPPNKSLTYEERCAITVESQ
jgi:hypothetical protein